MHNIMNAQKFFSYRQPAWHKLGYVSQGEKTILEVAKIVGIPAVYERPVYFSGCTNYHIIPGQKALVGYTPENGAVPYAIVSDRYHTVTHDAMVGTWHRAFEAAPVETLGILGQGERMFITRALPDFSVAGDKMRAYLLVENPITGKDTIKARTVSTRVVCQNTLMMALGEATERQIALNHRSDPLPELLQWLHDTYEALTAGVADIAAMGEAMAARTLRLEESQHILSHAYPLPDLPAEGTATDAVLQARRVAQAQRDLIVRLWQQSPTQTASCDNTLWGLYNAVAEFEQWGRKRASAQSVMFGAGAARVQAVYDACAALVG